MKNKITSLLFVLMLAIGYSYGQAKVTIKVKQDYETISATDHQFNLKKKPFTLLFHVRNMEGFLVGITQDEDIYRSAIGEADLEVPWFDNTGMADGLFNEKKQLRISDEAPSYWYFSAIDDHRFDKNIQGTQKEWLAERTVQSFYISEFSDTYKIQDMIRPVYVVIYEPVYDDEYNLIDKKILSNFKINW